MRKVPLATPEIYGHVTLVDEPGEPIRIRCFMPGEDCRTYPIDVPSFLLLAEQVLVAWLKRVRRRLI